MVLTAAQALGKASIQEQVNLFKQPEQFAWADLEDNALTVDGPGKNSVRVAKGSQGIVEHRAAD